MDFVHLHNHSEFSILDGAQTVKSMAERAAELGQPAIALTDHGRMAGLVSFYMECQKVGVKPICGMEAYITGMGRSRHDRINYTAATKDMIGRPGREKSCYHLLLFAKNELGYEHLCKLTTESYATGYYYKPRIDYELLEQNHEGLIVSSACILGEVSDLLFNNDYEKARKVAQWYKDLFGDDYYIEVMYHKLEMERKVMKPLRDLADELGIKSIITNDAHYTRKEDHRIQKCLMLINMRKSYQDSDVAGSFFDDTEVEQKEVDDRESGDSDPIFETPSELYLKTAEEMREACIIEGGENGRVEQEMANTLEIANKIEFEMPIIDASDTSQYYLPAYPIEKDVQYDAYSQEEYAIPEYVKEAVIKELHDEGHDEVKELSDYMSDAEIEALRFLMWMCERNLEKLVRPKLEARGEPLPMSFWIENPPEGFSVDHAHNSPDELWIKDRLAEGKTIDDILQIYRDRLAYETGVVVAKKFVNYFLIVQSYIGLTKSDGAAVGPGRGCLTPDNKIQLPDGTVKNICDVIVGDKIFDEKGEVKEVVDTFVYDVDEELCDITVFSSGHLKLTPDHRVLTTPAHRTDKYDEHAYRTKYVQYADSEPETAPIWQPASDIHKGDWVYLPVPKRDVWDISPFDLAEFIPENIKDRCHVLDNTIEREVYPRAKKELSLRHVHRISGVSRNAIKSFKNKTGTTTPKTISRLNAALKPYGMTALEWRDAWKPYDYVEVLPRFIPMSEDLAQFIGYFVADGNIHKNCCSLYFHEDDQEYIQEYSRIVRNIFGKELELVKPFEDKSLIQGKFSSPIIEKFIVSLVPWKTEEKKVPDLFMHLGDEETKALLKGLIDGDGSIKGQGSVSFDSICKESVYRVRYLAASLGMLGSVSVRTHPSDKKNWHDSYKIKFTTCPLLTELFGIEDKKASTGHVYVRKGDMFAMRVKSNKRFHYTGKVFDLKVDTDNEPSYTTDTCIVHNSGAGALLNYLSGITAVDPLPNDLLFFRFLNPERTGYP